MVHILEVTTVADELKVCGIIVFGGNCLYTRSYVLKIS